MESKNFIVGSELKWEQLNEGISRQILGYNDQIMMVKIEFKTDAIGYAHTHIHSQTTYIESGVFEFQIGDKTQIVKAGDGLYMEPNVIHGVKCVEGGILIDVFNPIRKDFI